MQAIILAAGEGTRLKELTAFTPKPMLKVGQKPLLFHIISTMKEVGITDFTIITKYLEDIIKDYFGDGSAFGVNIRYITQPEKYGTGAGVAAAESVIKDDEVFITFGDILVPASTYRSVIELYRAKSATGVLALNYVDDPSNGAAVVVDENQKITEIVEKPKKEDAPSNWNNSGVMLLSREVFDLVRELKPSPRGEYELTTAIENMIENTGNVYGYCQNETEFWQDIGTKEDLEKANKLLG